MGRLVSLESIQPEADWYLPDAVKARNDSAFMFKWPSDSYPHIAYVHKTRLPHTVKIEIREWAERVVDGIVVVDKVDCSYRVFLDSKLEWKYSYERENQWYRFCFKVQEDRDLFILTFGDIAQLNISHHPDNPDDLPYFTRIYKNEKTSIRAKN